MVTGSPNQVTTTVQVDGLYEKVTLPNSTVEEKHYLGNFAVITFTGRTASNAGSSTTRYLHTDHLGSLTAITDESGDLVELHNYDSWGQRRSLNATTMTALLGGTLWGNLTGLQLVSGATTKGYTGHENFDGVGIIHMNGRIYDPLLARFMQADPIIQDATDLQVFNRYAYVRNNPLSLTDPSGYMFEDIFGGPIAAMIQIGQQLATLDPKKANEIRKSLTRETGRLFIKVPELQAVVNVVIMVATDGAGAAVCAYFNTMVAGTITYQSGGNLGDIFANSAVAFTTTALTNGFHGAGSFGSTWQGMSFASGLVVGGAISKAQGGKFFDSDQFLKGLGISIAAGAATRWALDGFNSSSANQAVMVGEGTGSGGGSGGSGNAASASSRALNIVGDGLGKIWNLPNTAVGLAYGGIGHIVGMVGYGLGLTDAMPGISFQHNAIEFTNNPFGGVGAITLGNTITYAGANDALSADGNIMWMHEIQHTYQGQQLGIFYLPSNALGLAIGRVFGGNTHSSYNWNETGPQQYPPTTWK